VPGLCKLRDELVVLVSENHDAQRARQILDPITATFPQPGSLAGRTTLTTTQVLALRLASNGRGILKASTRRSIMDKQHVKGAADQVSGKLKEQVGKLTGDTSREIGGKAQNIKGKVEEKVGDLKDDKRAADRDALRDEGRNEQLRRDEP
jgi:uncharacterized protein YjbJ (UPF0337 family)